MYRDHTVGVVVPAYNEEGYVGDVIDTLPEFVDRAYVVDDGSSDGTWEEIARHATARNRGHDGRFDELVVPIRHAENRGVGGAIKTGYLRARDDELDVTAVLAGDGQMDPGAFPRYLDPIVEGRADYVHGNRFLEPAEWTAMPTVRLVGNVVLSYLTKIASGYWRTMDSQNGYTAISLEALRRVDVEGMYEYYGYCNDLLVRLNVAGQRVADVPCSSEYVYGGDWKSHISYPEYVPRVSAMLLHRFLWRLSRNYVLREYNPLAASYLLGAGMMGASAVGLARTLLRRRGDAGTWLLGVFWGALLFVAGTVLDMRENSTLEANHGGRDRTPVSREPEDDGPRRRSRAGVAEERSR